MANQPWWVQVGVKYGIGTLIALWFMYFFLNNFSGKLDTLVAVQTQHQADMQALTLQLRQNAETAAQRDRTQADQLWVQLSVQQRICLNTSKTDADRIACSTLTGRPSQ